MQFEVYKNGENLFYIDYYVAVAFGVGELLDTYVIGDRTFVKANEGDINTIIDISKNTETPYVPVYFNLNIPAIKAKDEVQFEVYQEDNTFYIDYFVAVAFGIGISKNTRTIGKREFVEVSEKEISNLIEISKLTDTTYIPVVFKLQTSKTDKDSIETVDFEVYQKDGNYLVDYIVAVSFGVGTPSKLQKIGNRTFVEINENELNKIIDHSNKTNTPFVPHFFNALDTKQVAKLLVYKDENGELYIASNAADVLGIKILCLDNIRPKELHSRITKEDLEKIIEDGKAVGIEIQPEYIELNNKKERRKDNNIKVISTSNRLFLPATICEEYSLGNKDVSIKIDGILYYETNSNEIDEVEDKGNKVLIERYRDLPLDVKPKSNDYPILEAYKNIENGELFLEDGVCAYCDIGIRNDATYINGKRCYKVNEQEIEIASKLLNATAVIKYFELEKTEVHEERNNKEELTIIKANSGMYLEEKIAESLNIYSNRTKTIKGKIYYRINENTIERLNNKYTIKYEGLPQRTAQFIVCTLEDNVYIDEYIANLFKYTSIGPKVRIEGKVYYHVTREQVDKVISVTSNLDTKLVPTYRAIKLRTNEGRKDSKFSDDDYLDELIPGTNVYKPRYRKYDESVEDYEYFLTRYYLTFFPNAKLPSKYRLKKEEINQDTNASRTR